MTDTTIRSARAYRRWLVGALVVCFISLALGFFAVGIGRPSSMPVPERALRVEPPDVRLEDRVYQEGDLVQGKFRLFNDSGAPLTINALRTSCSCLASVAEGQRTVPFMLVPRSGLEIALTTTALAAQGTEQRYQVVVESSDRGRRLPDRYATLFFRVADTLKANPRELRVYEAASDGPTVRSVCFYTYRDTSDVQRPALRVKGSKLIHAVLRDPVRDELHQDHRIARFIVDVMIEPEEDTADITGEIEVEPSGQSPITVPVTCTFQRDCRFQPTALQASGKPGTVVERDLFEEFSSDRWRGIEVVAKPERCVVEIGPFDTRTNKIHVKLVVPPIGPGGARDEALILAPRDRARSVRIPIHYSLDE
jgi:hypothetical protein